MGVVEVDTAPWYKVEPSNPSSVPVQLPVASSVNAPPVFCNPEPNRLLND